MRLIRRISARLVALALFLAPVAAYASCSLGTPSPASNLSASATGAAASITATITAAGSGSITNLTGFEISGAGATTAVVVNVTITGVNGGPLNYAFGVLSGATAIDLPLIVAFPCPLQASVNGVGITITAPSFGTGNLLENVVIHGY